MSALTDVFTAIANAIRSKKGVSTTYKPSEMASAISSIPTGITPSGTKYDTYSSNGTYSVDVTNYASHSVTVSTPTLSTTTLWSNSSPSSAFGQQTIDLSDNFQNYDAIKIVWRRDINSNSNCETTTTEMKYNFFGTGQFPVFGGYSGSGSVFAPYARAINDAAPYTGHNKIMITAAYGIGNNSTSANNNYVIPYAIYGLKNYRN